MVKDGGGGKLGNAQQVLVLQVVRGVQAAAGQKGVLDAGGQDAAVADLQVEIVQLLQQTAAHIISEISQMVVVDFVHRTAGLLHQQGADIPLICRAILLFQRRRNSSMVIFPQLPQMRRLCAPHSTGIRYVKDVFQAWPSAAVFMDECDPFGTCLHPPPHGPVP